jgi:hypothetical protein
MTSMRVTQLWRYPVKSFIGSTVDEAHMSELGIVGDRHWAIRDHERGGIRGAKKIGELMQFTAEPLGDGSAHVRITFPDGSTATSRDDDVHERLSAALGHAVSLEALPGDGNLDHFVRGAADSDDMMAELRGIFGRDENEPLPNFASFPPEVATYESPPGTHHDCWPLMIMTEQALAALVAAVPGSNMSVLRFRPSMVVDAGGEPGHPEFSWTGRRARIGECEVEFLDPCPRCIMVTRKVNENVGEDREVLRHIVRELNQCVGVYARVVSPGVVREGDTLEFV